MNDTLPKVVADYLKTSAGQYMVSGAAYFVWEIERQRICTTCSVPPTGKEVPGTMRFVRTAEGWRRK